MVEAEKESEELKTLKEILKWIKITGMKEVKELLGNTLTDDAKKLVYHNSDGIRGTKDFSSVANVTRAATISDLWSKWKNVGIIEKVPAKGGERGKKLFDLKDFGIEVPEIIATGNLPAQEVVQQEIVPVVEQTATTEETISNG